MKENTIVSLADEKYFNLLEELIDSINSSSNSKYFSSARETMVFSFIKEYLRVPRYQYFCLQIFYLETENEKYL